jgi:hypothetical protein
MLPAENPDSDHRNCIGLQRMSALASMNRKVDELHKEGHPVDADHMLDKMTELQAVWDNESV